MAHVRSMVTAVGLALVAFAGVGCGSAEVRVVTAGPMTWSGRYSGASTETVRMMSPIGGPEQSFRHNSTVTVNDSGGSVVSFRFSAGNMAACDIVATRTGPTTASVNSGQTCRAPNASVVITGGTATFNGSQLTLAFNGNASTPMGMGVVATGVGSYQFVGNR